MKINKFEEIIAWQKGQDLALEVYRIFSSSRDFSFRDQIQRASVSISNNIAEGFERKGNKEFSQFLFIAKGSCAEVRSMLYLAFNFEYINKEQLNNLSGSCVEISKILSALITSLK